jgi:hypothetical protein
MADNSFRAFHHRDSSADGDQIARSAPSDPLAELARLIGQSDPGGEFARSTRHSPPATYEDAPAAGLEWATDDRYDEPQRYPESRNVQARHTDSFAPVRADQPYERDDELEQVGAGPYSAPAANFDDVRAPAMVQDTRYRDERHQADTGRQLPALAPQPEEPVYETDAQWQDGSDDQSYPAEEYDDALPTGVRRGGVIVVLALAGLVTLGIGGAVAYRTMFGGAMLPSLPPIIKASNGPNKIIPSRSDSQADSSGQGGPGSGNGEKLVSREEQPLAIQAPPSPAPRVVSTIPVLPSSGVAEGAPSPVAPTPFPPAVIAPAPNAAPVPPPAPGAGLAEPKRIHTVIIRQDQSGSPGVTAQSPPAPSPPPMRLAAAHSGVAPAPRLVAPAPSPGANAPLALVPQQGAAPPPPPRARMAREEASEAPLVTGSPSLQGAYSVQLTSQRSEAEALAAFRTLRAKYPKELGGREPIIRRADLGAKGTFFRALVGPFASAEQAAGMCSSLKAAGGSCLIQKN